MAFIVAEICTSSPWKRREWSWLVSLWKVSSPAEAWTEYYTHHVFFQEGCISQHQGILIILMTSSPYFGIEMVPLLCLRMKQFNLTWTTAEKWTDEMTGKQMDFNINKFCTFYPQIAPCSVVLPCVSKVKIQTAAVRPSCLQLGISDRL